MASKGAKSPTREEYMRERRRLQSLVGRWKKRGLTFDSNPVPEIPQKITPASVRRLKNITAKSLESKAHGISPVTGERISAKASRLENIRRAGARRQLAKELDIRGKSDYKKIEKLYQKLTTDDILKAYDKANEKELKRIKQDFEEDYGYLPESLANAKDLEEARAYDTGYREAARQDYDDEYEKQHYEWVPDKHSTDELKKDIDNAEPEPHYSEKDHDNSDDDGRVIFPDSDNSDDDEWVIFPDRPNERVNINTGEVEEIPPKSPPNAPDFPSYPDAPDDIDWIKEKIDKLESQLSDDVRNVVDGIIDNAISNMGEDDYYEWVADNIDEIEATLGDAARYKYASPAINKMLIDTLSGGQALSASQSEQLNDAIDADDYEDYDV